MEAAKPDAFSPTRFQRFIKIVCRWMKRLLIALIILCILIFVGLIFRNRVLHGGLFDKNGGVERVVLIVVDGLRTDQVTPELAPNIYALSRVGAYSFKGLTDTPTLTPVAHMSLFTGVTAKTHGVNGYFKWWQIFKAFLWRTTIYDYAHEHGFGTQVLLGWPNKKLSDDEERSLRLFKFGFYAKGVDHMTFYAKSPMMKAERAYEILNTEKPTLMFLHFLENDAAGHTYGWMSKEQFKELIRVDEAIGQLKKNLERAGLLKRTLIVLTSDHGGLNRTHGSCTDIRCRRIPIIITGPGVKTNFRMADEQYIYDITPTILKLLGDTEDRDFEGEPIPNIYVK